MHAVGMHHACIFGMIMSSDHQIVDHLTVTSVSYYTYSYLYMLVANHHFYSESVPKPQQKYHCNHYDHTFKTLVLFNLLSGRIHIIFVKPH